jgi:predicted MFS family arabinose efflux permease
MLRANAGGGPSPRLTVRIVSSNEGPAQNASMTYRSALASPQFRGLFAAVWLATAGNVAADVAQTVLIYDRTRSPLMASLVFALGFLPYLFTGALLSGLVDRILPYRLLVGGYLAAAALTALMTVPKLSVGELLLLTTAAGFGNGLGSATRGALVRASVSRSAYVPAQSLMRVSLEVAQIIANPVGGFLIVLVSARGSFLIAAAFTLVAAVVVWFSLGLRGSLRSFAPSPAADCPSQQWGRTPKTDERASVAPAERAAGVLGDSLRGMRQVFALPSLRRLLLLGWIVPMFSIAPESLAAAYVGHHGGSPALVGWWLTGLPVGIVIGDIVGVMAIPPQWRERVVGVAAACSFVPYLAFFLNPPIAVCIPLLMASGLGYLYSPGLDSRVRSASPEDLFARMMAVNNAGLMTIQALGFPLAGLIATAVGPAPAVGIAGAAGIGGVLLLWRERPNTTSPSVRR